MKRLADFVLSQSWLVVVLFLALTVVMLVGASQVRNSDKLDENFPDNSPTIKFNDELAATFGIKDMVVVVLEGDIYTPEALTQLKQLTEGLEAIDGIASVTSVTNSPRLESVDGELLTDDLVPADSPSAREITSLRTYLESNALYSDGLLVGKDGKNASLLVEIENDVNLTPVGTAVQEAVASGWAGESWLAGMPITGLAQQESIGRDLPILGGLTLALILFFLFLNFRTLHGVLLPLIQVVVGVLWGMGIFGYLGFDMIAVTVIAPVAILAVGSSFSLHLLGRFYGELSRRDKREAIRLTLTETGFGVLVSGLAITAAMLTFLLSDLLMVRALGLLTATGVFSSLVAALVLFPALLNLLPAPKRVFDPENPGVIGRFLTNLSHWVVRRRYLVLVAFAGVAVVSILGAVRITPNTSLIAFFPENSPATQSLRKVEEVFGGSSNLTLKLTGDLQDPKALQRMLAFEVEARREVDGVAQGQSIATIVRTLHNVLGGEGELPTTREEVAQELLVFRLSGDVDDITRLMTLDGSAGIINLTTRALPTTETRALISEVEVLAEKHFGGLLEVEMGGAAMSELAVEDVLLHDFLISISLALFLVLVIDSLVRSFRAAAVTIMALVLTILLQYGVLGLLGIPLNIATMLMGALAIGVGDYAIHLTVRYLEERREGHAPEQAVHNAVYTSGRSILFTALTLGAGFASLGFSSFVPVQTLGNLMVFTVIVVGITSLTLLPAACLVFLPNPQGARTSTGAGATS